jgi:hypothetical protein
MSQCIKVAEVGEYRQYARTQCSSGCDKVSESLRDAADMQSRVYVQTLREEWNGDLGSVRLLWFCSKVYIMAKDCVSMTGA